MIFPLKTPKSFWLICTFFFLFLIKTNAQIVLINEHFQSVTIHPSITSDGVVSPTKAADGVCSQGMIQVNSGGYLQVDVTNCATFIVNMKSTGASARAVTVKYKKQGDAVFTVATTTLSVQLAAAFNFHTLFPDIITAAPITVRIEPTNGNIQIHDLVVTGGSTLSNAAEITAFKLPNQIGNEVINSVAGTISINMPLGTNLTAIIPQLLTISLSATVNPTPSVSRNFSSPITYTVTAQDNSTKVWTITVNLISSAEKEITAFQLPNQVTSSVINSANSTITVNMPLGSNLTNVIPTLLTISPNATINPTPSVSRNFSSPVSYTVTAQDNSTKVWTITTNLTASRNFDFNKVVGFASMAGDGFAGPTTGGQCASDTIVINGPSEFNKLCETLYYRQRAYAGRTPNGGLKKAPLVILLKAGIYDGTQTLTAIGANTYANSMMDIPEQGDLTFLGENNVIFKIGINVKRAWNVIIRNISFYDFADDGINIGYPETHHIWIDHCSLGNPTALPANTEVPDGACDVKDGASFVTISFCKFQHHWKTSLNGHSDNNGATDAGRLKITYYGNYFLNTNSRHPRVRFGEVHVLNNLYENVGLGRTGHFGYGLSASNNASVYAEGNFFLDTRWPMLADRTTADFAAVYGASLTSPNSNTPCFGLKSVNNAYDDSGLTQTIVGQLNPAMINPSGLSVKFDELITPNFTLNPSSYYNYSTDLLTAADVRILIPQYAGADKISFVKNCATIPLNLIHFSANKIDNSNAIRLNWQTANEEHVSHFSIERSNDGLNFNPLGIIAARNTKAINDYTFSDNSPFNSINYYRLRMVDFDGKETFSKIISLKDNATIKNSLKAYPSVSDAFLTVETTSKESATLKIVDVLGRVLMTKTIEASNSILSQSITIGALPNGVYSIILENKDGRFIEKFIKQ
jgi:pectate lyase